MMHPQATPQITASGNADAGDPTLTPPTNMTASRPSRRTVMNGKMNIAYFSHHVSKRDLRLPLFVVLSLASRALASLTRHLSCSLETRSRAAPMMVMTMDATRAKAPSQTSSVVAQ